MRDLWDIQNKFTKKVVKRLDKDLSKFSIEDKMRWTKEYLLCVNSECMEVLEQLNWKHHKPNDITDVNSKNILIELVDIQKYLWGLMNIWGIDYLEFSKAFREKSFEVEKSFSQNFELGDIKKSEKVCVIDIDGVLNDYPNCFYNWVRDHFKMEPDDYAKDRIKHEEYKKQYRLSGAKRFLEPNKESIIALHKLKELGYTIILLTNRPCNEYKNIVSDTFYWLDENSIPYDYVFWAKDRKIIGIIDKVDKIDFIVDDNIDTCIDFENYGIKSYLFGDSNIFTRRINSLLELEELK